MTYSSAYFRKEPLVDDFSMSLEAAQMQKYDVIIDKLKLEGYEDILEIGCGWGGFAVRVASRHPNVTWVVLTLSTEQADYAMKRVLSIPGASANQYSVVLEDYRTYTDTHMGKFDRVVSIEMIEAVGREYFDLYFAQIRKNLKPVPSAVAGIQAITMPDHRFEAYALSVDFIQMYIFPGGLCPSVSCIVSSAAKARMWVEYCENFGLSYAKTLEIWNQTFQENWPEIKKLGFDDYFR